MKGFRKKENERSDIFKAGDCKRIHSINRSKTFLRNIMNKKRKIRTVFLGNRAKIISFSFIVLLCFASINLQAIAINRGLRSNVLEQVSIDHFDYSNYEKKDSETFEFALNLHNNRLENDNENKGSVSTSEKANNKLSLFKTTLDKQTSNQFEKKLLKIKTDYGNDKSSANLEEYSKEALALYREYNILPDCFTYQNLSDFIDQITTSFSIKINQRKVLTTDSGLTLNVAAPFSVLSYVNVFGSVKPIGLSYSDDGVFFSAIPVVGNLTILNITLNRTGWYIKAESIPESPFFSRLLEYEISWKIDGPIWSFIWKNLDDEDDYVQFKSFFGIGFYNFFHVLIGNAITLGSFSGPQLDGRLRQFKLNQPFFGNFIWAGAPFTMPFSFTLYKTYPVPWTVGLEIGVIPTLGISVLSSLLYLKPR